MSEVYYGNTSMSTLKGPDTYRKRPATVVGTDDIHGCAHTIFEIIANSADEARAGFGKEIIVEAFLDGRVIITDHGRGVPMDWNKDEGMYNYELVYCTPYGSGKYGSEVYFDSEGLNGIGCTAAQYMSEYMVVQSVRDEAIAFNEKGEPTKFKRIKYTMHFAKGYAVGELMSEETTDPIGTRTEFRPDREVFREIVVPIDMYIDKIRRKAMLQSGLKYIIKYEGKNEIELEYKNGIREFMGIICQKPLIKNTLYFSGEEAGADKEGSSDTYNVRYEVAITFSRNDVFTEVYHNSALLSDYGVSYDGTKAALLKAIEEYGKARGKVSKNEKLKYNDVEELVACIIATYCDGYKTSFKHQTKTAINNPFIKRLMTQRVYEGLVKWLSEHKDEADKIVDEILINKQAREKADAIKKKVIRDLSKKVDNLANRIQKLTDCETKNPEEAEIYIVEGDSAGGAVITARSSRFQAVLPIRGKIINCIKEPLEKILNSDVIRDLIKAFGCGLEVKSKYIKDLPPFDISKLRYNKIIICTDADLDGSHIRTLLIAMFYRLCPSLLRQNKVYIVQTPLYTFSYKNKSTKKDEYTFAFSEDEKEVVIQELEEKGYTSKQYKMQRSKGLGENDSDIMWDSTLNPENRLLIPVEYPDDERDFADLVNTLLGNDIEGRKSMIEAYFDMDTDID